MIALQVGTVRGDPAPTPDVTGAPLPGNESGQTLNETAPQASIPRITARGILWIPKALTWVVLLPIHGSIWFYDHYDLQNRYYATFFNTSRSFGIHPTIEYATGFGLMFGGQLVSTNTFGENEGFTALATWGGVYQVRAESWLDSGRRLDPVLVTIGGNWDRFARLRFYGIGNNADTSPPPPAGMLIDPLTNDTAVKTFYRYQELRAALNVDWHVIDDLHLIGQGAVTNMTTNPSTTDPSINTVYDPADLVGFKEDTNHVYGQLELRMDRRRIARPPWETTQYTTGWLASGFIGGVQGFNGSSNFAHYAVDLQAFVHLALGPRMLWLRFRGEGVTGSTDEVPFFELPYLGGDFLRGYNFGRFRDRVSGLATAQYMWDVSRNMNGFVFVDAGRVYDSISDVTLSNLRAGFGGGLEIHSEKGSLISATLASSIDGGFLVSATLVPYWNEVPRWR